MYKIILSFFLLMGSINMVAQQNPKAIIENNIIQQQSAWNNGDLVGYMNGYWNNDSLVFIAPDFTTYGWKNILQNYKNNYATPDLMGELTFSNIKITTIAGNEYLATGDWFIQRKEEEFGGYFVLLFRNINDKWLIVMDYTY